MKFSGLFESLFSKKKEKREKCEWCKGRGWSPCLTCIGRGRTQDGNICRNCHGRKEERCPLCRGTGISTDPNKK